MPLTKAKGQIPQKDKYTREKSNDKKIPKRRYSLGRMPNAAAIEGSTFVSKALWKSDQMHQTFEKSSLTMTHKLDDMIELPKLQSKKTYKEELECEIVMVKIPKCMSWLDACDKLIGVLDMMEDKVENLNPQSTTQVLLLFKEYKLLVTHSEEVEETLGTSMQVEPLDKTQLEDLGLNTCNHDIPFNSREVPTGFETHPSLN
ncbi:hypothetical protein Tco_0103597 [Tanacetum coccineum]